MVKKTSKRERVSARRTAESRTSGQSGGAVKLPEGVNFFSVSKEGPYRLEIIPYIVPPGAGNTAAEDGQEYFERSFFTHRNVGVNTETVVCPARTREEPCPICEHRIELMSANADKKLIKDLAPKDRQLWNVYDHAEPEKGVQVWHVSYHLFGKLLYDMIKDSDEDEDDQYFADREDGKTVRVGFEKKKIETTDFWESRSIAFKARPAPLPDELFAAANILDSLLVVLPYAKLKDMYFQTGVTQAASMPDESEQQDGGADATPESSDEDTTPATATEAGLSKGDDVTYNGAPHTIFKISPDGTSLKLLDEEDNMVQAVAVGDVTKGVPEAETPTADETSGTTQTSDDDDDDDWDK